LRAKEQPRAGQSEKTALRAFDEVCGFDALNLSCEIKKAQVFNEGVVSENGK